MERRRPSGRRRRGSRRRRSTRGRARRRRRSRRSLPGSRASSVRNGVPDSSSQRSAGPERVDEALSPGELVAQVVRLVEDHQRARRALPRIGLGERRDPGVGDRHPVVVARRAQLRSIGQKLEAGERAAASAHCRVSGDVGQMTTTRSISPARCRRGRPRAPAGSYRLRARRRSGTGRCASRPSARGRGAASRAGPKWSEWPSEAWAGQYGLCLGRQEESSCRGGMIQLSSFVAIARLKGCRPVHGGTTNVGEQHDASRRPGDHRRRLVAQSSDPGATHPH